MRYYFSKLDNKKREIYKKFYYAMINFEENISLKGEYSELKKIYEMVLKDNPMLFYINPNGIYSSRVGEYVWFKFVYVYSKKEAERIKHEINLKLEPLEKKLNEIKTKLDRERFIHKYLMSNVKYKYNTEQGDFECHTIVGSLLNGYAVCDGISKAFKLLCNLAKINCCVVYGDSWNEYEEPQKHAWNMAKIGQNWYYIDMTWNINLAQRFKYVRYDYFNLRESDIIKDHRNFDKLEECNSLENNFFYENKCILNGKTELDIFLTEKFKNIREKNGSKNIYFKFYCEDEKAYDVIVEAVRSVCLKMHFYGIGFTIESNETQNVYLVRMN